MKFKSAIHILIIISLITVGAMGCKSKEEPRNFSEKPALIKIALPQWYAPKTVPAIAQVIESWNQNPDNTPLSPKTIFGKKESLLQKILMGSQRGDFADCALVRNEWLGRMIATDLVVPLPKPMANKVRAEALPALLPTIADDEHVYAVPFDADVYVMWGRKDLIPKSIAQEKAWSRKDFVSAAQSVKKNSKDALQAPYAFSAARSITTATAFLPWYLSFGGRIADESGLPVLDLKPAADAMDWLQSLTKMNLVPQNVAAMEQYSVFNGLAGGAFAFALGGSWGRGMLNKSSEHSKELIPMPIPGEEKGTGVSIMGGWSFVILKKAPTETAALLMSFFDPGTQKAKLENGLLPANKTVLSDPWFEQNADAQVFKTVLATAKSFPMDSHMPQVMEQISIMLAEVFLGRKKPVEAAGRTSIAISELVLTPANKLKLPKKRERRINIPASLRPKDKLKLPDQGEKLEK